MPLIEEAGKEASADAAQQATLSFRLRSYQDEMVEESLHANIIVAMDTGSGKTHIALARTAAELERCEPHKIVWFLTPTVALLEQQHKVFELHLPAYGIQVLSGKDGIEHWTDQNTWDAVLHGVRIVLSTHQVLLDALDHGFVKMNKLALIIFDEAHHCTQNHPANIILANHYHPRASMGDYTQLPWILGLSASPVMKASASWDALQTIERNMNAKTKTPKMHRSQLLRFVHRPVLVRVDYLLSPPTMSSLLSALETAFHTYDIMADPYVLGLCSKQRSGYDVAQKLQKTLTRRDTYCYKQLKMLYSRSKDMAAELGSCVVEWYIWQSLMRFQKMLDQSGDLPMDWTPSEKDHLWKIMCQLPVKKDAPRPFDSPQELSRKVEALVDILEKEASPECTGLIFVEQRVWVAALAEILSIHPRTRDKFNVGTFVGTSQNSKRRGNVAEFAEPKNQQDTLDKFRAGETNLILATSVLEEGIDVSSCQLVICFEPPKNLKSFVQRRGRARKQESRYYILLPDVGGGRGPQNWELLEEEMKRAYLDDERVIKEAEERENEDESGERYYRVESTGALLTLQNAAPHLNHFCATLGDSTFVDLRPQYDFESKGVKITAKVTLPLCVDASVRVACGTQSWVTERMAIKDAAFEAYCALHAAGLVNDNLLPKIPEDDMAAESKIADHTPSLVNAASALDPWIPAAEILRSGTFLYHRTLLQLLGVTSGPFYMQLLTPIQMPLMPELTLHWNETKRISVTSSRLPSVTLSDDAVSVMRAITHKILASGFAGPMANIKQDFLYFIIPSNGTPDMASTVSLHAWSTATDGAIPASTLIQEHLPTSRWGDLTIAGDLRKFTPQALLQTPSGLLIQATRVPKRRDFLHPIPTSNKKNEAYTKVEEFEPSKCTVSNFPSVYSTFALLFPSILHRFETYLVADTLRSSILKPLAFGEEDLHLILRALTGSATGEEDNYQRLEFYGDTILKLFASTHLMSTHPIWPESRLTAKKGHIVSNGYAARSTLALQLDPFIITTRFTAAKWTPHTISAVLARTRPRRNLSSKLLADVIESLIGTAHAIGGFDAAYTALKTLLPLEPWTPLPTSTATLLSLVPPSGPAPPLLAPVEHLLNYTFTRPTLLLEALTHASYQAPSTATLTRSYERLEFLGDAVLDYIISRKLYTHEPALPHQGMHAARSAVANAALLAFRMLESGVCVPDATKPGQGEGTAKSKQRFLQHFLRASWALGTAGADALAQHTAHRETILGALRAGNRFPWHLLALLDAPKFLSDIVESVLGAVYVDCGGDFGVCEGVLRSLGVMQVLERILADGVDCVHPKERVGWLAVERDVKYLKKKEMEEKTEDGTKKRKGHFVRVQVGGVDVGGWVEGPRWLNAETRAAHLAVGIMEGRGADGEGEKDVEEDVEMGGVELGITSGPEKDENEEEESEDEFVDAETGEEEDEGGVRFGGV